MFNCIDCGKNIGPCISPVRIITGTRPVDYHNEFYREDERGYKELIKVDSHGSEITSEAVVCANCARVEQVSNESRTQVIGRSFQEKLADPFRVPLVSCAVDACFRRLAHRSKRALRDVEVSVPGLKQFLDANKGIAV